MSKFSRQEIEYLQSQRLGRLATVDPPGLAWMWVVIFVPCSVASKVKVES